MRWARLHWRHKNSSRFQQLWGQDKNNLEMNEWMPVVVQLGCPTPIYRHFTLIWIFIFIVMIYENNYTSSHNRGETTFTLVPCWRGRNPKDCFVVHLTPKLVSTPPNLSSRSFLGWLSHKTYKDGWMGDMLVYGNSLLAKGRRKFLLRISLPR